MPGTCYVRRERVYRALTATTDPVPVLSASNYVISQPGTAITYVRIFRMEKDHRREGQLFIFQRQQK